MERAKNFSMHRGETPSLSATTATSYPPCFASSGQSVTIFKLPAFAIDSGFSEPCLPRFIVFIFMSSLDTLFWLADQIHPLSPDSQAQCVSRLWVLFGLSCRPPFSIAHATTMCREFAGILIDSARKGGTLGPSPFGQKVKNTQCLLGFVREDVL